MGNTSKSLAAIVTILAIITVVVGGLFLFTYSMVVAKREPAPETETETETVPLVDPQRRVKPQPED